MKHFAILLIFTVLLNGCRTQTATESVAESVINTTTALEKSLTAECKTEAITSQIWAIKTQIKAIQTTCQTEKDKITQEKLRWKWAFWGLIAIVGVVLFRKVLK